MNEKKIWNNGPFVNECIQAIALKPQHTQLIMTQLLHYLQSDEFDPETKIHILGTIEYFFGNIVKGLVGPLVEILIPIVNQISSKKSKDKEPSEEYLNHLPHCIGKAFIIP